MTSAAAAVLTARDAEKILELTPAVRNIYEAEKHFGDTQQNFHIRFSEIRCLYEESLSLGSYDALNVHPTYFSDSGSMYIIPVLKKIVIRFKWA